MTRAFLQGMMAAHRCMMTGETVHIVSATRAQNAEALEGAKLVMRYMPDLSEKPAQERVLQFDAHERTGDVKTRAL